ncbi:MAG: DUF4340 domain-containing protein [Ruminococcaceae bacterium]|nr:DUF4340 domain-containing protein [Oscillospiraceae bacterium]
MNKKLKGIIIAAASVVLLVGILLMLIYIPDCGSAAASGNASSGDAAVEDDGYTHNSDDSLLIDKSSDELSHLVLKNQLGTYTMRRSGQTGRLTIDELPDVPINDDFAEFVWYGALIVGWNYVILDDDGTTPDDLSAYGLSSPQAVCTAYYFDGSVITLNIGSKVPTTEALYYFMIPGHEGVYVTSIDESFLQGDSYWISDDVFGVDSMLTIEDMDIDNIVISGRDFPETATVTKVTTDDVSYPFYGYDYIIKTSKTFSCEDYTMSLLCDELAYLTADEAEVYSPDQSELAQYGLASPCAVIRFSRNGVEHIIRIGNKTSDRFYFSIDGINVIYSLSPDSYPTLYSLTAQSLLSGELHVRQFNAVSGITVSYQGKTYRFTVTRTPMPTDPELFEYYAFLDGKEIELNTFKSVLQSFNNADIAQVGGATAQGGAYLTVTLSYHPSFGKADEVFVYYPSEYRRYLCFCNGAETACATSVWMDKFIETVEGAAQNNV